MGRLPYPYPTSPAVTSKMRGNRSTDTGPEVRLRSALHRLGYRFRKSWVIDAAGRRVRPDIVFRAGRLAVFVDGCYWHGCPRHGHTPRANVDYWGPKLERNGQRDRAVDDSLRQAGWRVLRLWEHVEPSEGVRLIAAELAAD